MECIVIDIYINYLQYNISDDLSRRALSRKDVGSNLVWDSELKQQELLYLVLTLEYRAQPLTEWLAFSLYTSARVINTPSIHI